MYVCMYRVCAGVQDAEDFFSQICTLAKAPLSAMSGESSLDDMHDAVVNAGFEVYSVDTSNSQLGIVLMIFISLSLSFFVYY